MTEKAAAPERAPNIDIAALEGEAILARLAARASCRVFDGRPIDRDLIRAIVQDGLEAPSSCNQQMWHFVVLDRREDLIRCNEIAGGNPHFAECSALIYLAFQKGWTHDNFSVVQGVAAGAYHMILSAHLRGLASVWNAGIGDHAPLRAMMQIPPTFDLVGALAIGWPREDAPKVKAPRRPVDSVMSFGTFQRPKATIYPAKPAEAYPYHLISKADNPFAEWDPTRWSWAQLGDFRGFSVWAKTPLAGVYHSRRQGEATRHELDMLPALPPGARVAEVMGWGGTSTTALRARLPDDAHLTVLELSDENLSFIRARLGEEGQAHLPTDYALMPDGRLPLADGSLHALVIPQQLEHAAGPQALLAEAARVLRPDGALVLSVRNRTSRAGTIWDRAERRATVPIQGPYMPIPARRIAALLAPHFTVEAEAGIGIGTQGDAEVSTGPMRLRRRVIALRARPKAQAEA